MNFGYIVFKLAPYHANLSKRLIKRTKVYFWDTGLVGSLTGIRTQETYRGETKNNWPRPGVDFRHWQGLA